MNLMMQAAGAAAEGAPKGMFGMGGSGSMILMMVLIFAVMWLLMIRPQQKQQKELAKFRASLEKGTKVVTGGIHGTVKEIKAATIVIAIDKDVNIEVDKAMIMRAPQA